MNAVKIAAGITAVLLALFLIFTPAGNSILNFIVDPPSKYPESSHYTMDRNITLTFSSESTSYSVTIPYAEDYVVDGITLQKVNSQNYYEHTEYSEHGLTWVKWSGYGSDSVTASYDVECYSYIWDIDENNSLTIYDIPQEYVAPYLESDSGDGSEWISKSDTDKGYIIYTGGEVKELASEIVGEESNVYLILKKIYEWIDTNITYEVHSGIPQSALELLQSRKGDCDDQSVLFCSLARAAGVPAWLEIGALYNTSKMTWVNHVWVQAYIPTEDGGHKVTIDVVNDTFLAHTSRLFHLATDSGDGDLLSSYYGMYHYTYRNSGSVISADDAYVVYSVDDSKESVLISSPVKKICSPFFNTLSVSRRFPIECMHYLLNGSFLTSVMRGCNVLILS